ncbi:MAG: xanthine dehydrogenase family protein molybdopterin-binding subunit, partial [Proteobacteria bacterium]|nr:xanthine dehydrogenase family protein molybdopterin-binding subunit [Pseudomonadota bacterium]
MSETGIGARVKRVEDFRFLTGRGRYTDDLNLPGQIYAAFVRSPHAHARIKGIDAAAAKTVPGVVAVLTGDDLAADGVGGLPCGFAPAGAAFVKEPARPALAQEKVRFVGDMVALVVAESWAQARTGAEAVTVDYEELPACANLASAVASGAAQLHDDVEGNVCFDWELGDKAATDGAFANAHHVTKLDIVNNRKVPNALETRAALAEYDPASDSYTLYSSSQIPHLMRLLLAAFVLAIPENKLRVISPDVGGGFGSKISHYPEEVVVTWASKKVGRPVKWTADRSEAFLSDTHGRDHLTHAELALDADGKFLGLRVETKANL